MPPTRTPARPVWEDRFTKPTFDSLRAAMDPAHTNLFDLARTRLSALPQAAEDLVWHGIPWRWTFVYRHGQGASGSAIAYLVPKPDRPLIALPIPHQVLSSIRLKKSSRLIREGLSQAKVVAGVYWPQWELTSKPLLDEVVSLIEHRLVGAAQSA
ncbi:MAG TPA: hypothetical protein PLU35_04955 [Phycisphaerales bacterium]|nr:hypothetical protein [Phycisphaerales bacterium]